MVYKFFLYVVIHKKTWHSIDRLFNSCYNNFTFYVSVFLNSPHNTNYVANQMRKNGVRG